MPDAPATRGAAFLSALATFVAFELAIGIGDAVWFVYGRGALPHEVFPLVVVLVYLGFGLGVGAPVATAAALFVRGRRAGAWIGASAALWASITALAFFRWLPEWVDIGTVWGVLVLLLVTVISIGGGRLAATFFEAPRVSRLAAAVSMIALLLLLGALVPLAVSGSRQPFVDSVESTLERPNVLLIVIDTLRADRVGVNGSSAGLTPTIDGLAAEGTVFTEAMSSSCFTPPPHASLLTGTYPSRHGIRRNERFLAPANLTLAEIFKENGFSTFAVVSNLQLAGAFGWAQGFDFYDDSLVAAASPTIWLERTPAVTLATKLGAHPRMWLLILGQELGLLDIVQAENTVNHVLEVLDRVGTRPFFGFVNFMDPHYPYTPRDKSQRGSAARANAAVQPVLRTQGHALSVVGNLDAELALLREYYDEEIRYLDKQLARLFAELRERGIYDNTLIVLTSDHGEHFGEHQLLFHTNSLYKELVHVPLVVRPPAGLPGMGRNQVHARPVSLVDVAATVIEAAEIEAPLTLQGSSLLPLLRGDDAQEERVAVAEWEDERVAIWGDYKAFFVGDRLERVVRRSSDSLESEDLALEDPQLAAAASRHFQEWLERCASGGSLAEGTSIIDPAVAEQLRALGYLH